MDKPKVYVSKGSGIRFSSKGNSADIVEIEQEKFRRPQEDLEELAKKITGTAKGG